MIQECIVQLTTHQEHVGKAFKENIKAWSKKRPEVLQMGVLSGHDEGLFFWSLKLSVSRVHAWVESLVPMIEAFIQEQGGVEEQDALQALVLFKHPHKRGHYEVLYSSTPLADNAKSVKSTPAPLEAKWSEEDANALKRPFKIN